MGSDEEGDKAIVACSICLESVLPRGDRSTARLGCGHHFHLDCIGSAFNAKGLMQCPNCRKIEKGSWLYANTSRTFQALTMEDWLPEEEMYDTTYTEMPLPVQWCPFGISRSTPELPSLFEDGESAASITFHDFMGQQPPLFPEAVPISPAAIHPGPYLAYLHPLQNPGAPSSSSNPLYGERTVDGAVYHDQWSNIAVVDTVFRNLRAFPAQHNNWSNSLMQPNSNGTVPDHASIAFTDMRHPTVEGEGQQRAGARNQPFVLSNGSSSRPNPYGPPVMAHYINTHGDANERYQPGSLCPYAGQQQLGAPVPEDAFNLVMPSSSVPTAADGVDPGGRRFYNWERDQFTPYPLIRVDSDAPWPGIGQWLAPENQLFQSRQDGSSYQSRPDGSSYQQL